MSAQSNPLRRAARLIGVLLSSVVLLVGVVVLYAGIQNYFNAEEQGAAFGTTVLGLAITSFPLALLFTARAVKSYKKNRSRYELPDTPMRFFLLAFFSAGFLLISLVAILMYLLYSQA